jgi:hypothetical protein
MSAASLRPAPPTTVLSCCQTQSGDVSPGSPEQLLTLLNGHLQPRGLPAEALLMILAGRRGV